MTDDHFRERPALCGNCARAVVGTTRRGTVYPRCGRAAPTPLRKYPPLPKTACSRFEITRAQRRR